jgi:hypothetical protein
MYDFDSHVLILSACIAVGRACSRNTLLWLVNFFIPQPASPTLTKPASALSHGFQPSPATSPGMAPRVGCDYAECKCPFKISNRCTTTQTITEPGFSRWENDSKHSHYYQNPEATTQFNMQQECTRGLASDPIGHESQGR